jgi:Fur family zinc uptake transcriptional regulator
MAFHDPNHDHEACIEDALKLAGEICSRRGARLTELRRRVLELVWNSHVPIGAYDIIRALTADGRSVAPTTVYRVLAFLEEQSLIHRLESLNAYLGCTRPGTPHTAQFQICRECGSVATVDDPAIKEAVSRSAKRTGFRVTSTVIEIKGLCPNCQ